MKMMSRALALVILTFGLVTNGCLIVRDTTVETSGKEVPREVREQIVEGETTTEWLLDVLGEPSDRKRVDERSEILSYESVTIKEKESGVFLLWAGEKTVKKTEIARFELEDGVLVRHWVE